uniref:Uncharacterized protein n=1 Tax=Setaria italica TaxID=4555 RepID=K3ZBP0_SETIT
MVVIVGSGWFISLALDRNDLFDLDFEVTIFNTATTCMIIHQAKGNAFEVLRSFTAKGEL